MEPPQNKLKFKRLDPLAMAPVKINPLSAGADLHSIEDVIIPPNGQQLIRTGLQIQIPSNCYGRIAPRSGMAVRYAIDVGAGVIDPDYTGEIKILLFNFGKTEYEVKRGDRVAQIICEKIIHPVIEEMKEDLKNNGGRGDSGFGSSGR